ncbi:response regulator transcription factor [Prolixibacteraceae bacterium JC049]|nr:response regulator transcription factor [Prolixibacteraceae bacterium JC049]
MKNKIEILIVEDEFMIAEDLAMRLTDMGYQIADTASSVDEATQVLSKKKVDLALIDINLIGEKTGIDLAKIINEKYNFPFIFLTSLASKEVVEMAQEEKPAAYLLKPFNDKQLEISIQLALNNYYGQKEEQEIEKTNNTEEETPSVLKLADCLFLRKDSHYQKVFFKDILWLEASGNYTTINVANDRFMYSYILKHFEDKLPTEQFIRVHRSYIVNINNITGFEGNMLLIGDKKIPTSKTARDQIFDLFKIF